jgi:hypothetical protein
MMSEPNSYVSSSHTVAELKVMCKKNGLSVAGRKADLIARLEGLFSEESISLEEVEAVPLPAFEDIEEEILVAEFIEAEIIEESLDSSPDIFSGKSTTLKEQIMNPKVAAVLLAIIIAGGGWYWYVSNQLQPFTADDLRYGDSMEYTILNGEIDATGEYVDFVRENIDSEELEDACRLQLEFDGKGTTSVTNGGTGQLDSEPDNSLLGAVRATGAYGNENWLAVEKVQTSNLAFSVSRYLPNPLGDGCMSDATGGVGGTLEFDTKSWTELSERNVISTQADWKLNLDGEYSQGTTMSYGLGGLLGRLDDLSPGLAIIASPVELREMVGTKLIETDANGTYLGWDWRVTGTEQVGDEEMWKISMENSLIRENCFGYAIINLWVVEDSPWAVEQTVDIRISGNEGDKSSCGSVSKELADLVLPQGTLSLELEMSKTNLDRGEKLLDLGRSYNSPRAVNDVPTSEELIDWGSYDLHMPDNSTLRSNSLEAAVGCLTPSNLPEAVAANSALNDDGYIWRARDDRNTDSDATRWNLSWVSVDPNSGWVELEVSGDPSSANCTYIAHNTYDDTVSHSREDIPKVLSMSMLEDRLTEEGRFSDLIGEDGFFTSSGEYHPETRVGIFVVTPDGEYTDLFNRLNSGETGATTLDLTRSWTSYTTNEDTGKEIQWDNTLSLAMDATTGKVVGWNLIQTIV